MVKNEKLFDQFPPVSTREWMEKINTDLKGADFSGKLIWRPYEGFEVMPFYRREDNEKLPFTGTLPGMFPYLRGTKVQDNNWLVRQNIEVTDYDSANKKALSVLMKGVDSLGFIISDPESVSKSNFDILLRDIYIEMIEINFLSNGKAQEISEILKDIISERILQPELIRGAIEADPLGRLMVNGTICIPVNEGFDYLASLTRSTSLYPELKTIHFNANYLSDSGADTVRELAYGLSAGSEYMSQLTDRGIDPMKAAAKIRFSFGIGPDYFMEISKLRAARLLWSLIVKGFAPDDYKGLKMNIHSITNRWNKTIYDRHVNILRTQTEAMSAIIGGTDSLTVEPFDSVLRKPDEFSERIARNQQLILREESYFDKVADPAAGSYYVENLTNMIADHAWELFIKTEKSGGFLKSLEAGLIQKDISDAAGTKRGDANRRKLILVGTNLYPDSNETVSDHILPSTHSDRNYCEKDLIVDPIPAFRVASDLEQLRIAVEKSDRNPLVFLLTVGSIPMRRARAHFSNNFFGCGGYRIIDNTGFSSVHEGIKAAAESGADIVVICSSDEEYPQYAPEVFDMLSNDSIVVVAGNPPCIEDLKAKGLEFFIHMRSDIVETLSQINLRLGLSAKEN